MCARSRTRRCLVMAWRVSGELWVRSVMERWRPLLSLVRRARRVSSPRAAKSGAWLQGCRLRVWGRWLRGSGVLGDIGLDVVHLLGPSAIVHEEGFGAASGGDVFEAGLGDAKEGAGGGGGGGELDGGGGFVGIVAGGGE